MPTQQEAQSQSESQINQSSSNFESAMSHPYINTNARDNQMRQQAFEQEHQRQEDEDFSLKVTAIKAPEPTFQET